MAGAVRVDAEPIAVVGIGCRYPGGVRSADALWRLAAEGREAVGPAPADRGWDRDVVGGFLDDIAGFDADFFRMSPREAVSADPHQRLALVTAWEALEHAGIAPDTAGGPDTGVFLGAGWSDYAAVVDRSGEDLVGRALTGLSPGLVAGRVAHFLDMGGPALTLDTSSSSSLVAVHCAVRSLRTGETSLALAGGVAVMSTSLAFEAHGRQGGLAPDGRCKVFSADADGTTWAEGVGVLVLERLSDAVRNGRRVLALVRGTAVNHDGATDGLTTPSGPAQERLLRAALDDAGLAPADVDAVEAHGTGTRVGDPVEARALISVFGRGSVAVGSLKSNIGHAQAAAGVAGVIKMVMALRHGALPATRNVTTPLHLDWKGVELLREGRAWPHTGRPRRAGVSSFGIAGTNAHVVLEQAPDGSGAPGAATGAAVPWIVSAATESALDAQIARLTTAAAGLDPAAVGRTLAVGRAGLRHGAVLLPGGSHEVARGVRGGGRCAVLFPGQGSQRLGMGLELHRTHPCFAEAFDAVAGAFDLERPLREVVWGEDAELLDRTGWTQPALFAVEVALYRLLEHFGVAPAFVGGHSVGELVAAHVAGVFDLADAAALVTARARLMDALPHGGAMAAVEATEAEAEAVLTGAASLASVNGPRSVVVAGDAGAVGRVVAHFAGLGRRTRPLRVSHAFHSPLVEPVLEDFRRAAEGVTYRAPRLPVVSNLTGALAGAELGTPDYWVRHVRGTVRFADGVAALVRAGVDAVLEAGPGSTLTALVRDVPAVPVLRADRDEAESFAVALGRLSVAGVPVRWREFFGDAGHVDLPTYAFEEERHWPRQAVQSRPATEPGPAAHESAVARTQPARPPHENAAAEQARSLLDLVRAEAAAVLGRRDPVAAELAFSEAGFDSLACLELSERLSAHTGRRLPDTLVYDHPTPALLAEHLAGTPTAPALPADIATATVRELLDLIDEEFETT
ncbi:type I polyketide synthase [Actinosynnema sp. NPDC002837]